jgi:hypothetical protein
MRVLRSLFPACVLAVVACSETVPTDPAMLDVSSSALLTDGDVELKRPRVDVTKWLDETITGDPAVFVPGGPEGLGPGTPILITIPNEGRFGCTANFVWQDGGKLYLGAAGHCFLPAALKSTHGAGADYDASGVTVQACVKGCEGNFRSATLVGTMVNLGRVAYARQTDPTGTEDVGNDFGVVEIPAAAAHLVRPEMAVWGAFKGVTTMDFGKTACHYGNGVGTGETFVTKARVGVGGGSDADMWYGDFVGSPGDSGSGIMGCELSGLTFAGTSAIGVLTHLGVATGDVKYKGIKTKVEHGFILGTTIRRAIEMGREAGLSLKLVEP